MPQAAITLLQQPPIPIQQWELLRTCSKFQWTEKEGDQGETPDL
jgi:hypothetical protein